MSDTVVLEVIGGPMDGLRGLINMKGTVGRKVGNSLSLALDEEVSEHVGYDKHEPVGRNLGNSRNGKRSKTLRDANGEVHQAP